MTGNRPDCNWCRVTLGWRSRLRRVLGCGMCADCHRRAHQEAGIYLQSGGPSGPRGYRLGEKERS